MGSGERLNGIQEVSGSIPLISTKSLEIERFQGFLLFFVPFLHLLNFWASPSIQEVQLSGEAPRTARWGGNHWRTAARLRQESPWVTCFADSARGEGVSVPSGGPPPPSKGT